MIENLAWVICAGLMAGVCALHIVLGGRIYVRPILLQSEMRKSVVAGHYFCWHLVSLFLAALSAGYFYVATHAELMDMAYGLIAITVGAAALNLWVGRKLKVRLWYLPQWALFSSVAVVAIWGCL